MTNNQNEKKLRTKIRKILLENSQNWEKTQDVYRSSYNQAYHYLANKYGVYGKEKSLINTDKYSHDDEEIYLLMKQFYLGISVKKELYYKLVNMNIIPDILL